MCNLHGRISDSGIGRAYLIFYKYIIELNAHTFALQIVVLIFGIHCYRKIDIGQLSINHSIVY